MPGGHDRTGVTDDFIMDMWQTYRSSYGCVYTGTGQDTGERVYSCNGSVLECGDFPSCESYPDSGSHDYDPCGIGCSSGIEYTCQSLGYSCCDSCQSGSYAHYDADCSGQVCCETCLAYNLADSDTDGCIENAEIVVFVARWKVSSADVPQPEMIEAISLWETGSDC